MPGRPLRVKGDAKGVGLDDVGGKGWLMAGERVVKLMNDG